MNGSDNETPPTSTLFTNAPGASAPTIGVDPWTETEKEQIAKFKELIKDGKFGAVPGSSDRQTPKMQPYLLIRSFVGDNGTRPITVPFWESPDIWTAPGDPAAAPALPPNHGGVLEAGVPNTVYALVWNLGRAPLTGVVVSFYWVNPSLVIDGAHANLIGMTRVDLGPRNSPFCRTLVKCPKPWVPVVENGGHECLIARVWGFGDAAPPTQWNPWQDRHIGQRNVAVITGPAPAQKLVGRLVLNAFDRTSRVELTQVGAEAKNAVATFAPKLQLDQTIRTATLGTLDGAKVLTVAPPEPAVPRIVPRLVEHRAMFAATETEDAPTRTPITRDTLTVPNATLGTLLGHGALFDQALLDTIVIAPPPAAGQAHVLRLQQFDGAQLVGGYTLVVGNEA